MNAMLFENYREPKKFTDTDKEWSNGGAVDTVPTDIRLRIVSKEQWRKDIAMIGKPALAYAQMGKTRCDIVIPEGWTIYFRSKRSYAIWADPDNGSTLAHEILHCLMGSWHAD